MLAVEKVQVTSTIYRSRDQPKTFPLAVVSKVEVNTKQEHRDRICHYKQELGEWYAGAALKEMKG